MGYFFLIWMHYFSRINSAAAAGVVTSITILIQQQPIYSATSAATSNNAQSESTATTAEEVYSSIRVVQELIDRVVRPAAYLPTYVQYKGTLDLYYKCYLLHSVE